MRNPLAVYVELPVARRRRRRRRVCVRAGPHVGHSDSHSGAQSLEVALMNGGGGGTFLN